MSKVVSKTCWYSLFWACIPFWGWVLVLAKERWSGSGWVFFGRQLVKHTNGEWSRKTEGKHCATRRTRNRGPKSQSHILPQVNLGVGKSWDCRTWWKAGNVRGGLWSLSHTKLPSWTSPAYGQENTKVDQELSLPHRRGATKNLSRPLMDTEKNTIH